MKFHEYSELLEHFKHHSGVERIKCDLCSKWFRNHDQLSKHTQEEHQDNKQIICPDCGKLSTSNRKFTEHYRAEHMKDDGDTINCKLCNKIFSARAFSLFILHLISKHRSCSTCGKHFHSLPELKKHSVIHNEEKKWHACKLCGMSFSSVRELTAHKRTFHVEMYKHLCNVCGKRFGELSHLKLHSHSRIHAGEKPYACDLCKKLFTYKSSLKRHKKLYH